jgi:hypothetical protein
MSVAIVAPHTYAKLYYLAAALVLCVLVWFQGHRIGIKKLKPFSRHHEWYQFVYKWQRFIYAFTMVFVMFLWAFCSTFSGTRPSLQSVGVLVCLLVMCPGPWWYHRRIRDSVTVTFVNMNKHEIHEKLIEVQRRLVADWTGFTSAGHIRNARLLSVVFDEWSVSITVRLVRGMSIGHFTKKIVLQVESASPWRLAPGKTRILQDDDDVQVITIRYMLVDPHAQPFYTDPEEVVTLDRICIGLFETGAEVLFELVNTLIAGVTRAGKSNLVNRLIQIFAKIPGVAILGADFTPGSTEFRPWRDVMHALATDKVSFDTLVAQLLAEFDRRGEIMEKNGWKTFRCTLVDPFLVFIVDEAAEVKAMKSDSGLKRVCALIGKYGGIVIIATQYPTAPNLPAAITVNLPQRIGLQTGGDVADRVIFGATAVKRGFAPSVLIPDGRKGSFLIKNGLYSKPELARCQFIREEDVTYDVQRFSPIRTAVGSIDLSRTTAVSRVPSAELLPGDTLTETLDDIVDAVELTDHEGLVLDAIDTGLSAPAKIAGYTNLSTRTVNNVLQSLRTKGLATQAKARAPWYRA